MTGSRFRKRREALGHEKKISELDTRISAIEVSPKTTPNDHWSAKGAHLAQMLMVVVVILGYFFTVRPVIQKEKIAEELAQLEIEKADWQENLAEVKEELLLRRAELTTLNQKAQSSFEQLKRLESERESIILSLNEKTNLLKSTNKELAASKIEIARATSNLITQIENQILGNKVITTDYVTPVLNEYKQIFKFSSDDTENGEWLRDIKILWSPEDQEYTKNYLANLQQIKPFELINVVLKDLNEKAAQSNGIEAEAIDEIINKYEKAKKSKKHVLSCPPLPLDEWGATYDSLNLIVDKTVKMCVAQTNNKIKEVRGSISEYQPHQEYYADSCRRSLNSEIASYVQKKWDKTLLPCEQRLLKMNEIVLLDSLEVELEPFGDLRPPSLALIEQYMINYTKGRDFFVIE